jgi:hypothetical protein
MEQQGEIFTIQGVLLEQPVRPQVQQQAQQHKQQVQQYYTTVTSTPMGGTMLKRLYN